ncbi:MAG TPA: YceI family protein [Chitinophagaceae bacterium]|nr:YceI family protein [Chitinophagaceae bacterium]
MKTKLLSTAVLAALVAFVSCTSAPDSDEAKTTDAKDVSENKKGEKWNLNVSDSKIEWIGTKVSGYHTGIVPLKSGEMFVTNNEVNGGKFVMDIANMQVSGPKGSDTAANNKLLGHLKSADFFDVTTHPEGTFELTNVKAYTGDAPKDTTDPRQDEINEYKVTNPTHLISGNLTLKGVTKNIEFPARITVSGNTAEATAKFNIDRKEWGIVYPGKPDDLIRDAIHLGISIKAVK